MRPSIITWRLSFQSVPSEHQLREVCGLLAPIARVERAPGYGVTLREHGLSEHEFVEEPVALTPGETVLQCLVKAHRLAKGWCLMWPGSHGNPEKGWPSAEVDRAGRPEYLEGFTGMFSTSNPGAQVLVTGLEFGGFTIKLAPVILEKSSQATSAKLPPSPLQPPATGPEAIALSQSLIKHLVAYRTFAWQWNSPGIHQQLSQMGAAGIPSPGNAERFATRDRSIFDLYTEGEDVSALSMVLKEWVDPHLLSETAYDQLQTDSERLFSAAVATAKALLGTPSFAGASGETGFPTDQWAEFAACWPQNNGRILLELKQDDRELPLQLCLVFAP